MNRNIGRMALSALVMCSVLFAGCQKDDEKIADVGTEAIYGDYVGGVPLFGVTPFEEENDGFNVKMPVSSVLMKECLILL